MTDVGLLSSTILQVFLIALRVGTLWMFFPIFSRANIPPMVKVFSALAMAVSLYPLVHDTLPAWSRTFSPSNAELIFFAARELTFGLAMALVVRIIFSAAQAAADWVGVQMGLAMGGAFNPNFEGGDTSWADFHNWIAIMIFFGVGGHMFLIQAMAESYQLDLSHLFERLSDPAVAPMFWAEIGQTFFMWVVKLAGPLVFVLLVLQASLGILSKFIPQINIFAVSLPITIGVGVLVFSMLSPMYGDALGHLFETGKGFDRLFLKFVGAR